MLYRKQNKGLSANLFFDMINIIEYKKRRKRKV